MADPTTPNIGLTLPVNDEYSWDILLNNNFSKIDTAIGNLANTAITQSQVLTTAYAVSILLGS